MTNVAETTKSDESTATDLAPPTIDWLGDAPREHARDIITVIASYMMIKLRAYPRTVRLMPDGLRAEIHVDDMRDAFGMATLARTADKGRTELPWRVVRFDLSSAGRKWMAE